MVMHKWLLGLLLGGFLGIFDGLTAPLSAPETRPELAGIVVGSVFKGSIAGALIGIFSQKVRSLTWGIVFGLAVGAILAFGVALAQYLGQGRNYWWQIMLPGAAVGLIVGYVTQQHGRRA
jgi:peptidoglycan/LPS O-acetylase OafA/YrhL